MKEREEEYDLSMSSAELRKIRKPLIERKRRERINESLEHLKALLLQAYNRHDPQYTKMEKADILEMAVEHLQYLRASQATRPPTPYELAQKYSQGFRECVTEVTRCMSSFPDVTSDVRHRLMRHLNTYVDTMTACNGLLAAQGTSIPNQNRAYILPANQRPDYNANVGTMVGGLSGMSQFSPPLPPTAPPAHSQAQHQHQQPSHTTTNQNHLIRVPKPIKLEAVPYAINSLIARTPFVGPINSISCLGELRGIETTRVRSDHISSPEEGAATASSSASSSAQSSAETDRSRASLECSRTSLFVAEQNETENSQGPSVSRKLEFDESLREDGKETRESEGESNNKNKEVNQEHIEREEAHNDANNNNANREHNALHSDEEDDMWRPW